MTTVVAGLLLPATLTPAMQHHEVRGRLLDLLRHLLAAQRVAVLQKTRPHASYTTWRSGDDGTLHDTGEIVPAQAAPLPLVTAQGTGVIIERPRESQQIDRAVAELLGELPALLAPLVGANSGNGEDDILILSLGAVPHEGELSLALALMRRAATVLAGTSGAHITLRTGGRVSRRAHAYDGLPPANLGLSPREREVVQLVAAGLRNKEIALRLQISEKTVKFHLGRIFDKLGVDNRTEVLLQALSQGMPVPARDDPGAPAP